MIEAIDEIEEIFDSKRVIDPSVYVELYKTLPPILPSIPTLGVAKSFLSSGSGIKHADANPHLKPKIANPSSLYGVIGAQSRISKSHLEESRLQSEIIEADLEERKKLENQIRELQHQAGIEADNREGWSAIGKVASFVGTTSALVMGMSIGLTTGPAMFLVASGALGLFNEVMQDSGWEKVASVFTKDTQTQEQVGTYIHRAMVGLSLGLGVCGLGFGYQGGLFALSALSPVAQVAKVVNMGAIFSKTVAQSFQAYTEYKMQTNESILHSYRAQKSLLDNSLKERVNLFRENNEKHESCLRAARSAIYNP